MKTDMSTAEALDMMRRCKEEITSLRRHIAILEPKAEAYDTLAAVIRLLPRPSIGMGEDLVWRIEQRIKELSEEQTAAATPKVEG